MKRKDLAAHIEQITKNCDLNSLLSEQLTAEGVAQVFGLRRNTVSQSLTVLVEQGVLFKLNTRPVYYFHTKAFAHRFFPASRSVYASLDELLGEKPADPSPQDPAAPAAARDVFKTLIGYNGSLKKAVEQIKTSLYYPSNRLPVILTGPTGVGKTYLAQKAYQYALDNGVVGPTAPYINFNCAQYADNPELLSSHLFGYMKGAFTGAQATTKGLLDAADGGFLFLDEVHRLNWESQEKLFTFMDQGVFRRVGQSDGWNRAEVRLLLATTEDPSQALLATFLRRIPIHIQIPALEERGGEEKLQLIYRCFLQESRILNRDIQVSGSVLSALLAHTFAGNLGALENAVKYSCGSAQLKYTGQPCVKVGLTELPDPVLARAPAGQGARDRPLQDLFVTPAAQMESLCRDNHPARKILWETFEQLNEKYLLLRRKELDAARLDEGVPGLLYACFDKLLRLSPLYNESALMQFVRQGVGDALSQMEHRFRIRFRDGAAQTLALYVYACLSGHTGGARLLSEFGPYVKEHFSGEHKIARSMAVLLADRLEYAFGDDDVLFVTLALRGLYADERLGRVRALILDRGHAAGAIAAAANQLLGDAVYDALDIPLDDRPAPQLEEGLLGDLLQYVSENNLAQGLLLMGDKKLLEYLCAELQPHMDVPLAVMDNASVGMACGAGRLIQKGASLEELAARMEGECPTQCRTFYPKTNRPRCLLTCCITGVGTARQITGIIRRSLPATIHLTVLEQDYGTLAQQKMNAQVFKAHDVIGIVGTRNPDIKQVLYLPLEDLMTGQGEQTLYRMLDQVADKGQIAQFHSSLVQEFSLGRMMETLTILDAKKLLRQIERCLNKYMEATGRQISSSKKALVYFHVSCMVERLLRSHGDDGEAEEEYGAGQLKKMKELHYFLEDLETRYNIAIPQKELGYLYEILSSDDQ